MLTPERAGWRLPIPGSFAGERQDVGLGSSLSLPAELVGLGQAGLGQTGRGPESPIRVVWTREKKARPPRSPVHPPLTRYGRIGAWLALSVFPPAAASEDRREAEPRDTWPRPRAASGRRWGGGGRPETGSGGSEGPRARLQGPSPRPGALAPTLTRGAGTMAAAAAAATQRGLRPTVPSPLPSLATPLHSGKRSLPEFLSGIGVPGENYSSRCATRRGPATARCAGGEAKPGREAARASP